MAKIRFRDLEFREDTIDIIAKMNQILAQYQGRVSVRQLYYRFVARGWIANTDKSYDKIQDIATKARYAGMIDWDHIEDRNREAERPSEWQSGASALDILCKQFRLDRWEDQPFYVEIWVEKAALAGVLVPVSDTFHVTMMVNRGYSSASAMKEAADRIRARCRPNDKRDFAARPVVIYVGDHDPSGLDMGKRDIRERLTEFGCPEWLDVRMLALTMEQIEQYQCPPNPTKVTDSRAAAYIAEHGDSSWELDALPPDVLEDMLADAVKSYIDKDKMDAVITRENKIKAALKKVAKTLPK